MSSLTLVDLSRLQFAATAMYHFLFVPLTLGLSIIIAIMESVYVMTGRPIWREMTRFWGVLFGINFFCRQNPLWHLRRLSRFADNSAVGRHLAVHPQLT